MKINGCFFHYQWNIKLRAKKEKISKKVQDIAILLPFNKNPRAFDILFEYTKNISNQQSFFKYIFENYFKYDYFNYEDTELRHFLITNNISESYMA